MSGYSCWSWDTLADDYNEDKIAYSGRDMSDAYEEGVIERKNCEKLERENESLRALLGANIRVIKKELKEELEEEAKKA